MDNTKFVGRKNELENLHLQLAKKSASLVVIRGRRRIGKSRLVEEFAKGVTFLRLSGIPPTSETTDHSQRDIFAKQLSAQLGLLPLQVADWSELFTFLAKQTQKGKVVILFDEISWMGSKDPDFLGKLKNAWDIELSKNPNLVLILCGSVSTWIEKNIISSTGFFGRISLYLTLEELPLQDCNQFIEAQGFKGSVAEKFKILSVTGGVPWYLEQIQGHLSADENIKMLCFTKEGVLFNEFDLIFHDLFSQRSEIYRSIVEVLSKGPMEFSQICATLKYHNNGVVSEYLNDLINAGFLTRDYTWLLKSGKESRLSHYRLSDNYLRFYLKYIGKNKQKIIEGEFKEIALSALPGWETIIGLQFENLVLKNRREIRKCLKIRPEDVVINNPFFQRKAVRAPGCQIDYLIQTRLNTLYVCEIKFSRKEIQASVVDAMKEKIDRLVRPKGFSCLPVLIHVNGVSESVVENGYFTRIIDFSELLEDE